MKKLLLLAAASALLLFGGCAQKEPVTTAVPTTRTPTSQSVTTSAPAPTETQPQEPSGPRSPLTGLFLEDPEKEPASRPIAVMMGNTSDSLPQWGVGDADIIYEMTVEGRLTRLMCIFDDVSRITSVASVRSTRPYYMDVAASYGAVLLHSGASEPAYELFEALPDFPHIDGARGSWYGTLYYRNKERLSFTSAVHSLTADRQEIVKALDKISSKYDMMPGEREPAFEFSENHGALSGSPAEKVTVVFHQGYKPYFVYDGASGEYLRYEYGKEHKDGLTGETLAFKNVLVLVMPLSDVKGNSLGIVEIATSGSGTGYYICEGRCVPVRWEKSGFGERFVYTLEDGSVLPVCPGKTFVEVIGQSSEVVFE